MRSRSLRAFTLIEMMVVISIIGIVSAVITTSLSSYRSLRDTDRAGHVFGATLREAQNYALTGRTDSLSQENCYFGIRITSANDYSLVNYYRSGGTCLSFNTVSTYTLPAGVQFSGIASYPTVFAFSLPRAEVYTGGAGALGSLGMSQLFGFTKAGQTSYVCLYPTGRIENQGTLNSCP